MFRKKDILSLKTRRELYAFLDKNPGLNFREISRRLNIPRSTVRYHLNYLKKHELIETKSEGQYKNYYTKDKVGTYDKSILQLLRQEIPCLIFLHFLYQTFFSQKDICKELDIPPSTANYHIKKLIDMGIIEEAQAINGRIYPYKKEEFKDICFERKPIGREIIYIRKNQELIIDAYRVLITYKESLPNKEYIDSIIEFYDGWHYLTGIFLKKLGIKFSRNRGSEDDFYNFILDFFRPPFTI